MRPCTCAPRAGRALMRSLAFFAVIAGVELLIPSRAFANPQVQAPAPAGTAGRATARAGRHPVGAAVSPGPSRALAAPGRGVTETSRLEVGPVGAPFATLDIVNVLGDLRIVGHDGPTVVIEADKQAPDAATLARLRVSLVPDATGTVTLATAVDTPVEAQPVTRAAVRVDLRVLVPRAAHVQAEVSHGELQLVDVDGGGALTAMTGRIVVRNVSGGLTTTSLAGPQRIETVFGDLDLSALQGEVSVQGAAGPAFVASTQQGGIMVSRVASRRVALTTTDGAIQFLSAVTPGQTIALRSVRGDVIVKLSATGKVALAALAPTLELPAAARRDAITGIGTLQLGAGASETTVLTLTSRFGVVRVATGTW